MSVSENLAVQMHEQRHGYYCGPACAQMVLESIGAGLLDQDDLYTDIHGHSTKDKGVSWYTAPDELQGTMMDLRPPTFSNYFALDALDTEDAISRKLCWTIHHYQVAPIALVYGLQHWIVVRGYTASTQPADSADNTYAIDAFDINNPWPPSPSNEHVTYATWQSTYMTGVPRGLWQGKFVAVCDPDPPARPGGQVRRASKRRGSGELLEPSVLAELAVEGLRDYGLFDRKDWGAALRKAKPRPGVLVQRLDRLDSYYGLVPFEGNKGVVAIAAVDGRWGDYMQAALLPKPRSPKSWLALEQAFKSILGKRIDLGDGKGRLLVRKQSVCMYPHLVWRPCLELLSPYDPFYMFIIGDDRLYVRIDGAVFASLTLDIKGA